MRSLNKLKPLRKTALKLKYLYFAKLWGMDIHPTCAFSMTARFDTTFPQGVHVGERSYVAFGAAILTHDMTRGLYLHTRIGRHCFIGARSLILPGVTIGDESIVAAGSIVTRDVPPRTIVAGNPAQVIRENIEVNPYGRLKKADEAERRCREDIRLAVFQTSKGYGT